MVMKWLLFGACGYRVLTSRKQITGVLFTFIHVTRLKMCRLKTVVGRTHSGKKTIPEVQIMESRSGKSRQYLSVWQRFLHSEQSLITGVLLLFSFLILLTGCTSPFFTPSQSGPEGTPTLTDSPTAVASPTPL